ncbi:MAG TPA: two-component regulator propeller domain-containing protein, partial [Rhodothermales bacterium]|nr:two-component regulator propeller domain-containing protein [Rhodothermales bacterium]
MQQVYRTYSTRDGLPQATIQALEVDQRGWLWAATQNGVAYHNGQRWQALPALNRAMRTGFWQGRRILADHTSDLWFGTHGDGIYHLRARTSTPPESWTWTHYARQDGLPSDTVFAIHEDDKGTLWVGTAQGLGVFRDSAWTRVDLPDSLTTVEFYAIHEDPKGFVFGTEVGLVAYEQGVWSTPRLPRRLQRRNGYALYEDRTGTLWAGLRGGIAKRVDGIWQAVREEPINTKARQNENYVAIAEQADGALGFARRSGGLLRLYRDGTWDVLDERNGLPSRLTNTVYQHPDGSYWIGTASGLAVLRTDTWHTVNEQGDIGTASFWAIAEMRDGAMWFGASRSLSIYEDGRWRTLPGPDGSPLPYTLAIHEAQDGRIWIGTRRGLFAYNNGQWPFIERDTYINNIVERADSSLLFGTQDGVWQYAEGQFTRFAPEQPLLRGTVRTLKELDDGTLWFDVGETGVLCYDGRSWKRLSTDDGLPANAVLDVFKDRHGLFWFATTKGLALYDGMDFRVFTDMTPVRLPDAFTYRIEQDRSGRYYVSTNQGIARLTLAPEQQTAASRLPVTDLHFEVEHFGLADGLPELEANQGASLRDSKGRIWFGLIAGVAMMDPRATSSVDESLPLTIEKVDIPNLADSTFAERVRTASGPLALS